jgi:hypothetical protein
MMVLSLAYPGACRSFDVSGNKNIKGTIPAVLGKLTKLL